MSLHEVGLSPTPPSSMLHLGGGVGIGGGGGGGGCVPINMMGGLFGAGQLVVDEEFLHHYQVYDILASRSCLFAARSAPPAFIECDLDGQLNGGDLACDVKHVIEATGSEQCPVCGDKVSGYHYGLLTCESCKGFFKRTVQNKKIYSCIDSHSCLIDKTQRKRCPYCRFQKCLMVGMKLEAVRADRLRGGRNKFGPLYKRDRAMKQQLQRQRLQSCPSDPGLGSGGDLSEDGSQYRANGGRQSDHHQGMGGGGQHGGSVDFDSLPDIKPIIAHLDAAVAAAAAAGQCSSATNFPQAIASSGAPPYSPAAFYPSVAQPSSAGSSGVGTTMYGSSCTFSSAASSAMSMATTSLISNSTGAALFPSPMNGYNPYLQQSNRSAAASYGPPSAPYGRPSLHTPPSIYPPPAAVHLRHRDVSSSSSASSVCSVIDNSEVMHASGEAWTPTGSSAVECLFTNASAVATRPPPTMWRRNVLQIIQELQRTELRDNEVECKLSVVLNMVLHQQGAQLDALTENCERLLGLVCYVCDQALFLLVEWARNTHYFTELRVDDQMKLLQTSWSELLLLHFIFKQVDCAQPHELYLPTGHRVPISTLHSAQFGDVVISQLLALIDKFRSLSVMHEEFLCLKFLVLLNTDAVGLLNYEVVEQYQAEVRYALSEYCTAMQTSSRFNDLLSLLPDLRLLSLQVEQLLSRPCLTDCLPDNTLLIEMLSVRRH